ncbi:hypothetical protein BB561_004841 [Smittium simulii]|uniref:Amino acid transporter transmembrane domain-containing protein n=1 Tax=Smittium simulii TaxID=133385 RepID=A0A2T9YDU0_9FUNG|nr:hypothetical protein BB561_004841 [Smittium simulii]
MINKDDISIITSGTLRWQKRYNCGIEQGATRIPIDARNVKNGRSRISYWLKTHQMQNSRNWICLQLLYPELRLGLNMFGKIRTGTYWSIERLANSQLISKLYKKKCPCYNANVPETIEHILLGCGRWAAIRAEKIDKFIPRLYKLAINNNNQPPIKAKMQLVGNLFVGESKKSLLQLQKKKESNVPLSIGLETAKFMDGICVAQTLILNGIKCSITPLSRCPVGMEFIYNFETKSLGSYEGFFAKFALEILIICGDKLNSYDFKTNLIKTTGITGEFFMSFALMINGFGSCITYLMISSDIFKPLLLAVLPSEYHNLFSRKIIILLVAVIFVLPLLFFENLDTLASFSTLSILLIPPVIIILIIKAPFYSTGVPPLTFIGNDPLPAVGIIAFALMCTQTAYPNFNSLGKHNNISKWDKASSFAIVFSVIIYALFSIIGYLIFGESVHPNILINFQDNDIIINFARLCMSISIILTYPMQFYPMRDLLNPAIAHHMLKLIAKIKQIFTFSEMQNNQEDIILSDSSSSTHYNSLLFKSLTVLWFGITIFISILISDLGIVYKLLGTIAATLLAFILPACMYLFLNKGYYTTEALLETSPLIAVSGQTSNIINNFSSNRLEKYKKYYIFVSLFMLIFGIVILFIGTFITLI